MQKRPGKAPLLFIGHLHVRSRLQVFKAMHHLYVDATSSPFYTYGLPLTSRSFADEMGAVVRSYAQQLQQL